MSQELKHELTQCQVALADCRMEKEEVVKELTRLHERFALCSTAEYTHDCEVKILALNEQLETLSGLLAHEREARLFENNSRARAIEAEKARENDYQLQIERLNVRVDETLAALETEKEREKAAEREKERFRAAAENTFQLQAAAESREKAFQLTIAEETAKRKSAENRVVELLRLKGGWERDVARLRNEVAQMAQKEQEASGENHELRQVAAVAQKRADALVRQIRDDMAQKLAQEALKQKKLREEMEEAAATAAVAQKEAVAQHAKEVAALVAQLKQLQTLRQEEQAAAAARAQKAQESLETALRQAKEEAAAVAQKTQKEAADRETALRSQLEKEAAAAVAQEVAQREKVAGEAAKTLAQTKEENAKEIAALTKNAAEAQEEISRLKQRVEDLLGALAAKDAALQEKGVTERTSGSEEEGKLRDLIGVLEKAVSEAENGRKKAEEELKAVEKERVDERTRG